MGVEGFFISEMTGSMMRASGRGWVRVGYLEGGRALPFS